jgi:hypothetical protein
MRVFKNKAFSRFADKNAISDEEPCDGPPEVWSMPTSVAV